MYMYLAILLSLAASLLAQSDAAPPSAFEYLGLTRQQVASIENANLDYIQYQRGKQLRMLQVQAEIAQETAKSPLDPMALGLRYVELEVIRRELADQLAKTREANVAVLNDAQRTKLKVLEDAAKLQPTISDAQCRNLLSTVPASSIVGVPLLGASTLIQLVPACRLGNFSPLPLQP